MTHPNLTLFTALQTWLSQGLACWLCTVTDTWGSSPRPRGSLMAVNERGEQVGSLSGGCIEEELVERLLRQHLASPEHIIYGATAEEAERLQLPCGGTVGVLVEPVLPVYQAHIKAIVEALQQHQGITREVDFTADTLAVQKEADATFAFSLIDNQPVSLRHPLGPQQQLFIIGASDVAQAVAELAQWMGYAVIVCDPREEKLKQWPVPGCTLLAMLPDEGLQRYATHEGLVVLALTHDPRIDDMGLLAAFDSRAAYIGAMGSQKTSMKRRERLLQLGITTQQLQRLHAPVGLDIGSKTPREIAVAIMAELVQLASRHNIS